MKSTKIDGYKYVRVDENGHFFYQVFIGRDSEGRQRFKKGRKDQKGVSFTSPKAAEAEAMRVKVEYMDRQAEDLQRLNYGKFVRRDFIPKYKADVEASTFDSHKRMIMLSVDRFDTKQLDAITVRDCEAYRTWLMSDAGFSRDYANVCYVAFRQILGYAEHLGLVTTNVSMKTKAIPKGKAIARYWTKAEFERVLSQISTQGFYEQCIYVMLLFYYRTGVRVSEGFALTWNDIDLINEKARIYHTLYYKNKDDYQIKPYTKTRSGKRIITLDDELVQVLKAWRQEQLDHGVKQFVLSYDDRPMIKSTLNNVIHKFAKIAGVLSINGRGLRHSHASYLIAELGADVLTVSKRLGHSSPDVTLRYYSHMFARNDELIADKMVGSMNLTPAKQSRIKFNGNQVVPFNKVR